MGAGWARSRGLDFGGASPGVLSAASLSEKHRGLPVAGQERRVMGRRGGLCPRQW